MALLLFALGYRYFPLLQAVVSPTQSTARTTREVAPEQRMGFDAQQLSDKRSHDLELVAGPPVSLASSAVIAVYRNGNKPLGKQVTQWLALGDQAAAEGRLAGGDDSAAAWYGKVLEAQADNRAARAGLAEVARQLASHAHAALDDGKTDDARQMLRELRSVPLADAAVARLESRLEVLSQVTPILARAAGLLHGDTVSPQQREQALGLYRQVLELDPDNEVAREGTLKVQKFWLDKALAAAAMNDFEVADQALEQAGVVAPESPALQDSRSRIQGMRRMRARSLMVQADSALDSGDLSLARELADKALGILPDVPGIAEFERNYHNASVYAGHHPGQVLRDSFVDRVGSGPTMVVLPVGSFLMGSPPGAPGAEANQRPQHRVTITRAIAMARTEITVAQFRSFIQGSGYRTDAGRKGRASVYDRRSGRMHDVRGADWSSDFTGRVGARDDMPVVNISWNDASAYAEWLSARTGHQYRLASEAEFEYAMRAGTTTAYWWGDGSPTETVENVTGELDRSRNGRRWLHAFENYRDGYWGPAPVASFKPNPFGLYDMDGNVSEWVTDCWHDNYTRAPGSGEAWVNPGCAARVLRGGSWGGAPDQARSAYRGRAAADVSSGRVGFRVVRVLEPAG